MQKLLLLIIMITCFRNVPVAEKYFTKNGKISFSATAAKSPEHIEGINKTAVTVLDTKSGNIQFSVLMKGFEFERALMQEHFNENYVESNKFPKAEFRGIIQDFSSINLEKDGTYPVRVKGKLTLHGETKDTEAEGRLVIVSGQIEVVSSFDIVLADYGVSVPQIVADKVAKNAKISVDCFLEPLKKQ